MSESSRFAEVDDAVVFINLFDSARSSLDEVKGAKLWKALESTGDNGSAIFQEYLDDDDKVIVLGEYDHYPFGYILLDLQQVETKIASNIQEVFVDIEARNVGLGETMMSLAIDWSRNRGASLLLGRTFPGDRSTKNFFERHHVTARLIEVSTDI